MFFFCKKRYLFVQQFSAYSKTKGQGIVVVVVVVVFLDYIFKNFIEAVLGLEVLEQSRSCSVLWPKLKKRKKLKQKLTSGVCK